MWRLIFEKSVTINMVHFLHKVVNNVKSIEGYNATSYGLEIKCLSRSGNQVTALCFLHDLLLGSYCSTNMNLGTKLIRSLTHGTH